jgi:uncharacterized protein (TIGR02145 family)
MYKVFFNCVLAGLLIVFFSDCNNSGIGEYADSDSTPKIKIGSQVWMTKNLNVDTFRNGDKLPEAQTNEEWESAGKNKQPAWCYYDNETKNGAKYGKLYNWYAVNDPRGLAPIGWHVPSEDEWITLTEYLGGGYEAGRRLKSEIGWNEENIAYGTNDYGFSAYPGGRRIIASTSLYGSYEPIFLNVGDIGIWWASTKDKGLNEFASYTELKHDSYIIGGGASSLSNGYSVRCIKD